MKKQSPQAMTQASREMEESQTTAAGQFPERNTSQAGLIWTTADSAAASTI